MTRLLDAYGRPAPVRAAGYYDGGATAGRLKPALFPAPRVGFNAALLADLRTMQARVRAFVRSHPDVREAIRKLVQNLIGTGVKPQSKIADATRRRAVHDAWEDWTDEADADGRTDYYGLQLLVARLCRIDGEAFVRFRPRRPEDGLSVPLQIQVISSAHVPVDKTESVPGGGEVVAGVQFDAIGRRVGYWMHPRHPEDVGGMGRDNAPRFVPASQVLHVYETLDAGQVRGEPPLAAAILTAHVLDLCDDGHLTVQQVGALLAGFIRPGEDGETPLEPADAGEPSAEGVLDITLEPGMLAKLPRGAAGIEWSKPPTLPAEYDAFTRRHDRRLANGCSVPYELLSGEFGGVTFSSLRAAWLEFQRGCEVYVHSTAVPQLDLPVWRRWLADAVVEGAVPIGRAEFRQDQRRLQRVAFIMNGWKWLDPESEANAARTRLEMGIDSRRAICAAEGLNVEELDRDRVEDAARPGAPPLPAEATPARSRVERERPAATRAAR